MSNQPTERQERLRRLQEQAELARRAVVEEEEARLHRQLEQAADAATNALRSALSTEHWPNNASRTPIMSSLSDRAPLPSTPTTTPFSSPTSSILADTSDHAPRVPSPLKLEVNATDVTDKPKWNIEEKRRLDNYRVVIRDFGRIFDEHMVVEEGPADGRDPPSG